MQLPDFDTLHNKPRNPAMYNLALAMALADRAFEPGSYQEKNANPGGIFVEKLPRTFPNTAAGWDEFFRILLAILEGVDSVIKPSSTLHDLAVYHLTANGREPANLSPADWAMRVAHLVGVDVNSTIGTVLGVPNEEKHAAVVPVDPTVQQETWNPQVS